MALLVSFRPFALLVPALTLTLALGAACGGKEEADPPPAEPVVDAGPVVSPPVDAGVPETIDAAVDAPFSMKTFRPSGKGLWIWTFDHAGMTPVEAATLAKQLGISYVLIKSGQDASFWPQRFNASIVGEFVSRGIRVLAWPYITPAGGAASIDAAAQAALVPGCDGLVLDVEIEWEKGDNAAAAKTLCNGIRQKAPGVWLAYTSFGWAGFHTKFPFSTFDAECGDAAFPQVYFSDRGVDWDFGLKQAFDHYAAAGLKAPMWPITSNDNVLGTKVGPTTASLNAFFDAAGPLTSLWVLTDVPAKRAQLPELHWANP